MQVLIEIFQDTKRLKLFPLAGFSECLLESGPRSQDYPHGIFVGVECQCQPGLDTGALTNQRPVSRSRDHSRPIRGTLEL